MKRIPVWMGGIALAGLTVLLWRRLRGGVCPARFAFVLDNPVMRRFAEAERLMRHMDLRPGMRVLDAGCGPGRLTIPFARRVGPQGEVGALDLQAGMLRRLAGRVERAGLKNVRPFLGGLGQGVLETTELFDRVKDFCIKSIHDAMRAGKTDIHKQAYALVQDAVRVKLSKDRQTKIHRIQGAVWVQLMKNEELQRLLREAYDSRKDSLSFRLGPPENEIQP